VAFQWNTGYYESIHSFANGIATIEGGMHEEGFRKAITNVVNRYARKRNLQRKGREPGGEDIREASRRSCPFAWQSRSSRVRRRASSATSPSFVGERATNESSADWLEENPKRGRTIVAKSLQAARAVKRRATRAISRDAKSALDGGRTPGQARRLFVQRTARVRTVHRRGQLGRQVGEGRAQSSHPGDPADSRQDP